MDQLGGSPAWRPITAWFDAHVRNTPEASAVETAAGRRSYAELGARVDRLAARLAAQLPVRLGGDAPLVGVCLERDLDLPAWLLAILKIGAAYLPLDPTLPAQRLAFMLEDAEPALIVASAALAHVVASASVPILVAEEDADEALPPAPVASITPNTLAYVIFTSGSTGRPKGVEIEHRSLVALMETMATDPGFRVGERMLGITRISFDLSVPDLFLPFVAGGTLILADLDTAADPERLAAFITRFRPDLMQGTPSTWRALVETDWTGSPTLRILAGGEAMTRALADRLLSRCGALWNIYGPTETTVWSTACRVEAGDGPIPIGWPLDGATVAIVDEALRPVALGEQGEIVIGGTGVARGYRARPTLTADRFVTLPDVGEGRWYRTGDLGRIDAAGALFCLGRADDQVKLRGFRIELGDVEAALAADPAIGWCAARLWTDRGGEPALVGYVVGRGSDGDGRLAAAVRARLAERLAPYMIPDRIVCLPVMPLTPNGKVDRAALPDPFAAAVSIASVAATDDTPARLAAIWCELLGVAAVGPDDDFFALGGYSLMTVRLARRIEGDFGERLQLIELLRHSTLAGMAARIDRGVAPGEAPMLLTGGGDRPPLFWLDAGPLIRGVAQAMGTDQPVYALNVDAADEAVLADGPLAIAAVAALLRRQLVATQPQGPYYLGGWCRWGIVAFELAQQLRGDGCEVALVVLLDTAVANGERVGLRQRLRRWMRRGERMPVEPPSLSQRVELAGRAYRPARYDGDVLLALPFGTPGTEGWGPIVDGELSIVRGAGDHVAMVRAPHAAPLGRAIGRALAARQRDAGEAASRPQAASRSG